MATIINTPPSGESSDSGLGLVLGVILAIVLVALFIIYGIPALRQNKNADNGGTNINVTLPTPSTGGTNPTPTQ